MVTDTIAPWAESAPLTAEILQLMPDDGWRYELVQGRLVRMPPTGYEHGRVTATLLARLHHCVEQNSAGVVLGSETGFLLSREGDADTVLAPDAAFIAAARVPGGRTPGFLRLAPDLVCEVASPGQTRPQLEAKARLYLQAGVRLVWVLWPDTRTVDVWHVGAGPETMDEGALLTAGEVVPGFACPVRTLFS
jgi:Uma2 family endonuclease